MKMIDVVPYGEVLRELVKEYHDAEFDGDVELVEELKKKIDKVRFFLSIGEYADMPW